ncbi:MULTISPECIES: hypothetical protein [unclassified Nostoc]|nr:hypothetical protein [Nostoc sp. KVJ20]
MYIKTLPVAAWAQTPVEWFIAKIGCIGKNLMFVHQRNQAIAISLTAD